MPQSSSNTIPEKPHSKVPDDYTLRRATPDDMPDIINLAHKMMIESPNYRHMGFNVERFAKLMSRHILSSRCLALVIKQIDGPICGFLFAEAYQREFCDGWQTMNTGMYLVPECRKLGMGDSLVLVYKAWARCQPDVRRIMLVDETGTNMDLFVKLAAKHGFEHCSNNAAINL